MFTFNYYALYRNSKAPGQHRRMLVEYALKYGIKSTAWNSRLPYYGVYAGKVHKRWQEWSGLYQLTPEN